MEDDGCGIAPANVGRVFERFYRAPGATTAGSGLGLSIVRRICDLQGASVEIARSGSLGGANVIVRFPSRSPASDGKKCTF